ncbi:MAG: hypothetical protein A3K19_20125 [Lentisphaerae bacterium RIFOXYB12_FULL_65_16]|nr:MAG: hypothetical protein A3K19_20125 [Lentisphaerae bacterium RIFOXYB12_FULL_65_16]
MKVGIVGCGGIARAHLGAYKELGAQVAVVFDVVPAAAEAMAKDIGAKVAASVEEAAATPGLEAVSICTPPAVHCDNSLPFLKAGIPVLCEKPLEVSVASARKLAAAVKKTGTPFMTAYCHRFHPAVIKLKELLAADVLGRPLLMRNIFGGYVDISKNHRANPKLSGGGTMVDNGSHSSDLFRFLVGDPTHVSAVTANIMQDIPVEDIGLMHLQVGDKALGEIVATLSLPVCGNWIELYCSKGTAVISYWNEGHADLSYKLAGTKERVTVDCSGLPQRFPGQMAHFLECAEKKCQPATTVEDGLKATKILCAAYKSAQTGRRVKLSL